MALSRSYRSKSTFGVSTTLLEHIQRERQIEEMLSRVELCIPSILKGNPSGRFRWKEHTLERTHSERKRVGSEHNHQIMLLPLATKVHQFDKQNSKKSLQITVRLG
jgi:hypothetical protein